MRWTIAALLLANLSYCLWHQFEDDEPKVIPQRATLDHVKWARKEGLRPLLLIEELGPREPASGEKHSPDGAEGVDPVKTTAAEVTAGMELDKASADGRQTGSYLELVRAADSGCVLLGPFSSEEQSAKLVASLVDLDLAASAESRPEVMRRIFWVHLPPLETREQAVKTVHELRQRGIDSFLIEQIDAIRNGISLGVFNERESAERHRNNLRRKGLEPEIYVDSRSETRHYVKVNGPFKGGEVVRIAASLEETMVEEHSWAARRCQPIASALRIE